MGLVSVAAVQAGMRLSNSVTNKSGVVLLEAGTILTGSLIARLQNAHISSVYVHETADRAKVEEMLSQLRKRFEKKRGDPHMALLEEIVKEHIEDLYVE